MSLEYLEDLETHLEMGRDLYACQGQGHNQWYLSSSISELRNKARRVTLNRRSPVGIYHLIDKDNALPGDSFLVVRKILQSNGRGGDPHLQWILVDTKDAAEMLRDVSYGPSPYFGATLVETCKPSTSEEGVKRDVVSGDV